MLALRLQSYTQTVQRPTVFWIPGHIECAAQFPDTGRGKGNRSNRITAGSNYLIVVAALCVSRLASITLHR
jgi:hypothetical protein